MRGGGLFFILRFGVGVTPHGAGVGFEVFVVGGGDFCEALDDGLFGGGAVDGFGDICAEVVEFKFFRVFEVEFPIA